jgi:hypothetical protein
MPTASSPVRNPCIILHSLTLKSLSYINHDEKHQILLFLRHDFDFLIIIIRESSESSITNTSFIIFCLVYPHVPSHHDHHSCPVSTTQYSCASTASSHTSTGRRHAIKNLNFNDTSTRVQLSTCLWARLHVGHDDNVLSYSSV